MLNIKKSIILLVNLIIYQNFSYSALDMTNDACDKKIEELAFNNCLKNAIPIIEIRKIIADYLNSFDIIRTFNYQGSKQSVEFFPNSLCIASLSKNSIKIWDILLNDYVKEFELDTKAEIDNVNYSPDGKYFVTSDKENNIKIWDLLFFRCVNTLKGHNFPIVTLSCSPNSKYLASGSSNYDRPQKGELKVWDLKNGILQKNFNNQTNFVKYSNNGKYLASTNHDTLYIKHAGSLLDYYSCPIDIYFLKDTSSLSFSKDDKYLAVSCVGFIKLLDIKLLSTINIRTISDDYKANQIPLPSSLNFSIDGKYLFTPEGQNIKIWDIELRRCVNTFVAEDKYVIEKLISSATGKFLVSYSYYCIKIWCNLAQLLLNEDKDKAAENNICSNCEAPNSTYKCNRCKITFYCSRECMNSDFHAHRENCKTQ